VRAIDREAPLRFLRTAFQPDDWVAIFLKSYETGRVTQRVGPLDWVMHQRFQAWLRFKNSQKYNVYVAWNWGTCLLLFWRQFASCSHGAASVSEEEVRMHENDVRWDQYPTVAGEPTARAWLAMQAARHLARHTVETYGRSMEDFLRFTTREGVHPEQASREHLAAYVRDLLGRRNPRQPKVVHLDSGAGLANATILLRLSVVRLFFDHLVEEGIRRTNPAGRMHWRRRYGRTPGDAPLIRRHRRLPWIPTEEQWQAVLAVMQTTPVRTRLMFALSYDAALRRHELLTLDTTDIDPAHRLIRIRAEHAKNRCERVVPYSAPTAQLYTSYLRERRAISRARGPLFLSVSNRNAGHALSIWSWSKTVADVARVSDVRRFTTHTLRHLCLTDLARAGWDIHEIAAFAGHRSLASTLLYIHVSGRELSSKLATTMQHLHAWRVQHLAEVQS
jgi:integrase/recombinase XerD